MTPLALAMSGDDLVGLIIAVTGPHTLPARTSWSSASRPWTAARKGHLGPRGRL